MWGTGFSSQEIDDKYAFKSEMSLSEKALKFCFKKFENFSNYFEIFFFSKISHGIKTFEDNLLRKSHKNSVLNSIHIPCKRV